MKIKRLKGGQKEKWKKGHSCATNPNIFKHREEIKGRFFQKIEGESTLTVEGLAQHTAALSCSDGKILVVDPEDDESVGNTFNTFASRFTTRTIPCFEKFFQNFTVESELHKLMLAAHAAAQQYCEEANLTENATCYMCSFMEQLKCCIDDEKVVAAVLSLMARVIRKVKPNVLKFKYSELEKLLSEIFRKYRCPQELSIITNVIGCFSVALRYQGVEYWKNPFAKDLLKDFLHYTVHDFPKIRKSTQHNISVILKGASFVNSQMTLTDEDLDIDITTPHEMIEHPAAKQVGEFIISNLTISSEADNGGKAVIYLLTFLHQVITTLPTDSLSKCSSCLLGLMSVGNSVVCTRVLKVFKVIFVTNISSGLDKDINVALINALRQKNYSKASVNIPIPHMNDEIYCSTWITVITAAIVRLGKFSLEESVSYFSSWVSQLIIYWKSEHESIHDNIFYGIEYLLDECIHPYLNEETAQTNLGLQIVVGFNAVKKALSYQYESAWPQVYRTLAIFYKVIGKYYADEMKGCLEELATTSKNPEVSHRSLLENVVGSAINNIGPQIIINTIPIEITGIIANDEKNFWILPLLRKYVKDPELSCFLREFLPLAIKCEIIINRMKKQASTKNELIANTYQIIEHQIWALFPTFANDATDIENAISSLVPTTLGNSDIFAKVLHKYIINRDDLRIDILAGLRTMIIASNGLKGKLATQYSKNFMPSLLNLYLTTPKDKADISSSESTIDPGQRLAVLNTIEAYLEIISNDKVLKFYDLALQKYQSSSDNLFKQKALLQVIKCFVPYLPISKLSETIEMFGAILSSNKNHQLQKPIYRILEAILSVESEEMIHFIAEHFSEFLDLWINSQKTTASNAKAARLKCAILILQHLSSSIENEKRSILFKLIIHETITCCSNKNSAATKKNAFSLLNEICQTIQRVSNVSIEEAIEQCFCLFPKLDQPSELTPNIIIALISLFYKYADFISTEILFIILEKVIKLLNCSDNDTIKSCLAFIRVVFVKYPPVLLSPKVDCVLSSFVKIPQDVRKKFRVKIRDILASFIRKFGADRIKALVPEEDKMHKMVINMIKIENRKKRGKKQKEIDDANKDENEPMASTLDEILAEIDNDIEDDGKKNKPEKKSNLKNKKKAKETWILEDEDHIVDLLDIESGEHIKSKKPKSLRFDLKSEDQTDEEKYGFRIDKKTNKFVITEGYEHKAVSGIDDDDYVAFDDLENVFKKEESTESQVKVKKRKRTLSEDSIDSHKTSLSQKTTLSKAAENKKKFDYGAEFRSKKAGGDHTKKGGIAPYSYIRFSREKLNKRKKAKYAGQFKQILKAPAKVGKNDKNNAWKRKTSAADA